MDVMKPYMILGDAGSHLSTQAPLVFQSSDPYILLLDVLLK